ncbi:hypothetical protein GCM10020218_045290 [Dactylosporangium vinaceum]
MLIERRIEAVDELWSGPPTSRATRDEDEVPERYSVLHNEFAHENVIRFFERNQTLVNTLAAGKRMREQMGGSSSS